MSAAIWQCYADRKTGLEAIAEFCRTYWGKPRKAGPIAAPGTFRVEGGEATYRLELVIGRRPVYRVTRLATPEGGKDRPPMGTPPKA